MCAQCDARNADVFDKLVGERVYAVVKDDDLECLLHYGVGTFKGLVVPPTVQMPYEFLENTQRIYQALRQEENMAMLRMQWVMRGDSGEQIAANERVMREELALPEDEFVNRLWERQARTSAVELEDGTVIYDVGVLPENKFEETVKQFAFVMQVPYIETATE